MPTLALDKNNIEDVDRSGECHIYDEATHICMARPIAAEEPKAPLTGPAKIIDQVEQGLQDNSDGLPFDLDPRMTYEDDEGGFFAAGEW